MLFGQVGHQAGLASAFDRGRDLALMLGA